MTPDTERMVLEALRTCSCPSPATGSPEWTTVDECVKAGDCGCDCGSALSAADREAQSGGETEQIAKLRDPLIPQGNLRPLCIQAAATIERLTRELAEAREAIHFAAEAGFEWPADPMPRKDTTDGHD
jgi:hypothetical protein